MARYGVLNSIEPFKKGVAITPSDVATFAACDALWVGDGNINLTVTMPAGNVTFNAVPDGTLLPISVTAVKDTDTDATNIIALYW